MEIKFRVWDTRTKSFLFKDFHLLGEVICFSLIDQWLRENDFGMCSLERYNDLVFQQFSGFKDKNNKDIYEGDILKYTYSYEEFMKNGGGGDAADIGVVVFEDGCFQLKDGCLLVDYIDFGGVLKENEILGNIFENPELLK